MLCLHDTIHDDDPAVQRLLSAVEDAHSLTALILAAWQVARVLTIHLVEAVLAERSQHPENHPPPCRSVGRACAVKALQSARSPASLGANPVAATGRTPSPMGARRPGFWTQALVVQPHQRSSGEFQALGCALAGLVPFAYCEPACWAGTVGALAVHRRCGDGCKRRVNKRWRHSRSTCMR